MSKDAKAIALGLCLCALVAGLSAGLPWAVRRAEHPPPPWTQPLVYTGEPAPNA